MIQQPITSFANERTAIPWFNLELATIVADLGYRVALSAAEPGW